MKTFVKPELNISWFNVEKILTGSGSTAEGINSYMSDKNISHIANFSDIDTIQDMLTFSF
ncbi:MAG: hypothetical protein ACI4DP_08180 [Candidatus Ornithomonoglobus sp.]